MIKDVDSLWQAARGTREFPKQSDIGAHVLQGFTSFSYIIDVLDGGQDFAVRFMGTDVINAIGSDYTGLKFSDNPDHPGAWRAEIYRAIVECRRPVFTHVSLSDFERDHVVTECGLFPLADKEGNFNMILCCVTTFGQE
jgi:hypothetical protein